MKKILLLILALIVLSVSSFAQLEEEITTKYCENEKYDKYELCEPGIKDYCPQIGMMLNRIVMVCNERNCGCLPAKTGVDCGNDVREGTEMCEAGFDFCPQLSEMMGVNLVCDPDTCWCKPGDPISYCGDGKVRGVEDCEENSDCDQGKYCDECVCKDSIVEEVTGDEEVVKDIEEEFKEISEEETDAEEVLEEEKVGLFKTIWRWFIGLFS